MKAVYTRTRSRSRNRSSQMSLRDTLESPLTNSNRKKPPSEASNISFDSTSDVSAELSTSFEAEAATDKRRRNKGCGTKRRQSIHNISSSEQSSESISSPETSNEAGKISVNLRHNKRRRATLTVPTANNENRPTQDFHQTEITHDVGKESSRKNNGTGDSTDASGNDASVRRSNKSSKMLEKTDRQSVSSLVTPSPIMPGRSKKRRKVAPTDIGSPHSPTNSDSTETTLSTPCSMSKIAPRQQMLSTPNSEQTTVNPSDSRNQSKEYISTPEANSPHKIERSTPLPAGVIDIDSFPHQCCLFASQSHVGYSWMKSKRRCQCIHDSNHCSDATTTETYMGTYGIERFGDGTSLQCNEWKTENWWLEIMRKEQEMKSAELKVNSSRNEMIKQNKASKRKGKCPPRLSSSNNTCLSGHSLGNGSALDMFSSPIPTRIKDHLDYLGRQPYLTVEMRAILMDWLVELSEEYKLGQETLYLSTTLVDRSLACSYGKEGSSNGKLIVEKEMLQCLGCACTLIASKLEEITPPTPDEFVYISDSSYSRSQIIEMERNVCITLKFNLNFRTPYHYVHRFLRASQACTESKFSARSPALAGGLNNATNKLMEHLVLYILDLSTLEYKFVTLKPSIIAASAVYLARATLGIREPMSLPDNEDDLGVINLSESFQRAANGFWSKTLEHYTGYDMWDLEDTVKILRQAQENAETSNLKSTFTKHKSSKCMSVALKTVLNEENLGFV